ncbi:hypothetical protein KGY73_08395 [bacterium]|nr:hypothetical protein [bacterium]
MRIKKFIILWVVLSFGSSLLFSQNVVELSKKEKERRAKLKGKKSVEITNADLKKARLHAAVSIPQAKGKKKMKPKPRPKASAPQSPPEPSKKTTSPSPSSSSEENLDKKGSDDQNGTLKEKWEKAKEYVELLSLKLRALWQKFYSMDEMNSRAKIKKDISETHLRLKKAQQKAQKLEKQVRGTN